ncbi:MAG: S-(hydroxymethyl)mycothiol dehydrogenase [Verrucomicrobiales bacterium]|nr:S-(hydroxymethyl)mycothiol dehydrogenase [Verrucomicrobiales bacterium]
MNAQAAIADGRGNFSIEEIEVGSPLADEVLVEIKAAGICHTDHASLNWKRPLIMGHEGAGIVREVGASVTHVKVDDRVVLNWAIPCEHCFQCQRGMAVLCEESKPAYVMEPSKGHAHADGTKWCGKPIDRSFNIGTLSSLTLVKAAAVTLIPESVPFTSACIVGCGVMTGFGSAVNVAKIERGSSVVVIGVGGVGLNVIQGAKVAGAGKIIAVARKAARLEVAKQFGATHTMQVQRDDKDLRLAVEQVKALTNGRGADYAFEATSVPELAFSPLLFVRNGGMALQLSGINDAVTIEMPAFMWDKIYITPLYGQCIPNRDFPKIFDLYQKHQLKLDELVTRTYPLAQLGEALDDMMQGRNSKGVITFN